jgi:hypothetical protein
LASDRSQRTWRQVVAQVAGHGHRPGTFRVAVLAVTADLSIQPPPVTLQLFDHVADLHGRALGGQAWAGAGALSNVVGAGGLGSADPASPTAIAGGDRRTG